MVGIIHDLSKKMTLDFKEEGDIIYVLGNMFDDISCSEYLHHILKIEHSPAPHFDLDLEYDLHESVLELIDKNLIVSAHDLSEGGLFIALCESCFHRNLGFEIALPEGLRKDGVLFGETQGRVVVSVKPDLKESFEHRLHDFPFMNIGTVTRSEILIDEENWSPINFWKELYDTAIEKYLSPEFIT
jgi:phosphoribosylformylglycinamidine synthase